MGIFRPKRKPFPEHMKTPTREALKSIEGYEAAGLPATICMKTHDKRYGLFNKTSIYTSEYEVYNRATNEWETYESLEAMLDDGWIID